MAAELNLDFTWLATVDQIGKATRRCLKPGPARFPNRCRLEGVGDRLPGGTSLRDSTFGWPWKTSVH